MSLPVSQYEALLAEVRGLRQKAQRVQQLARPLLGASSGEDFPNGLYVPTHNHPHNAEECVPLDYTMESLLLERQTPSNNTFDTTDVTPSGSTSSAAQQMSLSSEPVPQRRMSSLYHGTWPVEKTMWNSEPSSLGGPVNHNATHLDVTSVMSFASSSGGAPLDRVLGGSPERSRSSSGQLETKVDMVYSLLAMLGGQEHADMGETLLALSTSPESCLAMRQSGCIPLLVQQAQSDRDKDTRIKALQALHNLVHSQPDEKIRKRETRILKLLETTRTYTEALRGNGEFENESSANSEDGDKHPVQTVAHVMKLSFDEGHRQAICQLGGIYTIATLVEFEHKIHGSTTVDAHCILMRRYACMALTNLTFGDSGNKALLCSFREFMRALVVQLQSPSDELRQVTASVLRNLSWRADATSKEILREVGSVTGLMTSAMLDNKENTLKSILSALWNLSAHGTENKAEICGVIGALGFLVDMLTYKTPSKSSAIIENSGGILRNISSQIAVREDYREILRAHNCLQILLDQLKSASLTIVSNACGTLWNLSAKNVADQEALWEMGAPSMLRSLNHSKHKMIAMGSSAALKNLLSARPQAAVVPQLDSTALSLDLPVLPTLGARKQKALLQDLDSTLSETYENIEKDSPIKTKEKFTPTNEFVQKNKFDEDSLNNTFGSLNLNEPSTSFSQPKVAHQNYGSTSLPYMKPRQNTFIPVRNNFSDCAFEDEIDSSDQPIDYSQKYSETKLPKAKSSNSQEKPSKKESYSIYAETDLDQPTDYSLRYAEDDSDSDLSPKNQDTVKTYCTEDTPYETPFNFSTATSMSDLRTEEKPIIDNDKLASKTPKTKETNKSEKDRCSIEDISDLDPPKVTKLTKETNSKSQFSSGILSPEKPVNYCEEGTPGYFSRVSSFGSLNSMSPNETLKSQAKLEVKEEPQDDKVAEVKQEKPELKAVKFEQQVNYAEETPLMFSRSSSLASLDSVEQHSIHDDRSSVVSDFSRLTSGIVSPSELPDSPTQTVPPSPRPRKQPMDYPSGSKARPTQEVRPQPLPRTSVPTTKSSIFEDNTTKFKEESTPIQFSTATSLSSLTIDEQEDCASNIPEAIKEEQKEKQDSEKEDSKIQESEDEEDILAACINVGMQNNRAKIPSKLPSFKFNNNQIQKQAAGQSSMARDTVKTYCTEDTPAQLSHAGSNSDLSLLSIPQDKSRRDYLSDDSSNLSGDNDNILAECIQSGMPKQAKTKPTSCLPRRSLLPKIKRDEETNKLRNNEIGASYLAANDELASYAVENSPCHFSLRSSLSDLTVDGSVAGLKRCLQASNQVQSSSVVQATPQASNQELDLNISNENNCEMERSRRESLSSISVESLGSLEADQALLEQCISSGMPKANTITPSKPLDIVNTTKPVGIARQFVRSLGDNIVDNSEEIKSKNGNVASAAGSTKVGPVRRLPPSQVVAGVAEENPPGDGHGLDNHHNLPHNKDTSQDKCLHIIGSSSNEPPKNGFNLEDLTPEFAFSPENCVNLDVEISLSRSCEVTGSQIVDNRMLDPDAMIESLDRFTAELVSQASHLKTDNTWNEDSSQNDPSFPSLSGSPPNVITFSSKAEKEQGVEPEAQPSNDFSSFNTSTMTDSTLIAIEATKMMNVFKTEAEMSLSTTSIGGSLEMDPPLIAEKTPKKAPRKKSLPVSMLVKRALSNSLNFGSSIESLSNLDHMNPPSDFLEMDGSLTSLASLPSESAELKPDFLINGMVNKTASSTINPIFNVKQPNFAANFNNSLISDLENINPPSCFNEITDLCNSLADVNTATIGSETEVFEDCFTHVPDTLANDATEFSDANSVTPIPSDLGSSSNESTPKKTKLGLSKSMMTKQRRNLARDRYKTYTVAAEMVMRQDSETEDFKTANEAVFKQEQESSATSPRMTPKERRRMDRSRFETRVLDEDVLQALSAEAESKPSPSRTKLSIRRSFMQKRLENRDRFRTQTLTESSFLSDSGPSSPVVNGDDLHEMLQKEADLVLKRLKETKTDEMLDCETLSLVSNDDDSEHNSGGSIKYRTYHKSWGLRRNVPVVAAQPEPQEVISDNEEVKAAKPKIVKPEEVEEVVEEPKGIRGRRKPLYSKAITNNKAIKPIRNMASNLVKNVTSSLKVGNVVRPQTKPQAPQIKSSGYGKARSPKTSPSRLPPAKAAPPKPKLERQGTFTKEEPKPTTTTTTKIPTFNSKISRLPAPKSSPRPPPRMVFNRSTSADSREPTTTRKIQTSSSSQSLKSAGAVKKSAIPGPGQRSNSNSNITPKKQVTSKIANLWKKIEDSKKQPPKKDSRVWIQNEPPKLTRSNTFDNKEEVNLRSKPKEQEDATAKRVSRLGSFIIMDENGDELIT